MTLQQNERGPYIHVVALSAHPLPIVRYTELSLSQLSEGFYAMTLCKARGMNHGCFGSSRHRDRDVGSLYQQMPVVMVVVIHRRTQCSHTICNPCQWPQSVWDTMIWRCFLIEFLRQAMSGRCVVDNRGICPHNATMTNSLTAFIWSALADCNRLLRVWWWASLKILRRNGGWRPLRYHMMTVRCLSRQCYVYTHQRWPRLSSASNPF